MPSTLPCPYTHTHTHIHVLAARDLWEETELGLRVPQCGLGVGDSHQGSVCCSVSVPTLLTAPGGEGEVACCGRGPAERGSGPWLNKSRSEVIEVDTLKVYVLLPPPLGSLHGLPYPCSKASVLEGRFGTLGKGASI